MISVESIKIIAIGLGNLLNDVVFVGGAFVNLYSTDKSASDIRPTDDIDCVVNILHLSDYNRFEEKLRKLGFKNDMEKGAPICRYIYREIKIDFIPTVGNVLGFKNQWYSEGFKNSINYQLSKDIKINIFSSVYFLASKIDAYWDRGRGDIRLSTDFEDIIFLLDSRKELIEEIRRSEKSVKKFIKDKFKYIIEHPDFAEGVISVLPPGAENAQLNHIKELIIKIISV